MMVDGAFIDVGDLTDPLRGMPSAAVGQDESLLSLRELQMRHVIRVLALTGGNKLQAAKVLGISRATIYQLLTQVKNGDAVFPPLTEYRQSEVG
jgi:transcriptional regulator of acetoin/glycerol metabolism